jgi:hypothetical protein
MARRGILPRRLASCPIPVCTACMYGKATRRPWKSRSSDNQQDTSPPSRPGECVSVDQLSSPTPGLIAQMTGYRTKQRYTTATVYVDQATGLGYVHLQNLSRGNGGEQESLRSLRKVTWRLHPTIPRRQWYFQGKLVVGNLQGIASNHHVCWSRGTPPKRGGREKDQRTSRHGQDHVDPCSKAMAQSDHRQFVALCHQNGKRLNQHDS